MSYLYPQLHAYDQALSAELGPFQDFVQWFRLEEDIENEARARGERVTSPHLDAVRAAVERFMSTLPGARFSNLRAERTAVDVSSSSLEQSSLVVDKAGQRLALDQLSDGERTLLLLVADVARRLAIANPGRPDPLSGSGLVLIDEVELHLHPGWQRAVLPGLRRTFPGLQLIVATHSPQVLSRVPSESVILLSGFQVAGAAPPTYGRDSNAILEEVMSVPERPEEMKARLKDVGRLIDEGLLVEARAALDQVTAQLGNSDAEVVRLGTLIEFLDERPAVSGK
jgi:predicted ATP-binding protein involved in virulence